MNISRQDKSDYILLLKSILGVLLTAAVVLLFVRHGTPVRENNKFYGGSVSLLVAHTPEDRSDFRRWAELNDPSRIFGYRSEGIFFSSVERKKDLVLPSVRIKRPDIYDAALFRPSVLKNVQLEFETVKSTPSVAAAEKALPKASFVFDGIPVFDEKGKIAVRLKGIPDTNMINALLLRVEKNMAGAECRIIESSGDRNFDRKVADAVTEMLDKGEKISGILAVWPDSKERKK